MNIDFLECNKKNFIIWAIQLMQNISLVVARQNVPIMSVLTNFTLGSWKILMSPFRGLAQKKWYGKPLSTKPVQIV